MDAGLKLLEVTATIFAAAVTVWGAMRFIVRPLWDTMVSASMRRNREVHEARVREYLMPELEQLVGIAEAVSAMEDSMSGFEESLLRQGRTLNEHVLQVFTPLNTTLTRMEGSLERIAESCTQNSVDIGELRGEIKGLWDGPDRRQYTRRSADRVNE